MESKSILKIPNDKKKRIIEAGIKEFGKNGFALSSTNSICSSAGISKGLLFHYFETKKLFYFYLGEHLSVITNRLLVEITNLKANGFSNFIEKLSKLVFEFWSTNNELILFYERVKSDKIFDPLEEINNELRKVISTKLKFFKEIRKDVEMEMIYDILIGDITFKLKSTDFVEKNIFDSKIKEKIRIIYEGIAEK